jgi:nucleotide-binding universal stress UspA family protein
MARTIRRIVVALDDSADSRLVLEEAVALAARMKAELSGLFVEDTTLLNAAQLSLTRQVNFSGQTVEALDSQGLERVLRGQAEAIRRALGQAAQRHDLTWSFCP